MIPNETICVAASLMYEPYDDLKPRLEAAITKALDAVSARARGCDTDRLTVTVIITNQPITGAVK